MAKVDPLQLPLRDIHLPDPVSWWPPAPGWWLLLAGVLICLVAWRLGQRWRARPQSMRASAFAELSRSEREFRDHHDGVVLAANLSSLLRRVSVSLYPRTQVASLTGQDWLRFLDETAGGTRFSTGVGAVLADAPYRRQAEVDADALLALCRDWISAAAQRRSRGSLQNRAPGGSAPTTAALGGAAR